VPSTRTGAHQLQQRAAKPLAACGTSCSLLMTLHAAAGFMDAMVDGQCSMADAAQ
jgi:hypothetical protein